MSHSVLVRIVPALLLTVGMVASARSVETPQHIDVKKLSKTIEDVVVPLPNEVFKALDKIGPVNWREYVRSNKGITFKDRPRIALLLGTVIADGFIAVQAEDAPTVKDIGHHVLDLSRGLGVRSSIVPHAKAIIEAADKKDWANVRLELDRTQNSVQQAMNEVHDEKLSQLVSLGGWLRGTEVLTAAVDRNFTPQGAELLHQPDLLMYFQRKIKAMPEFESKLLASIRGALADVQPLIEGENTNIPPTAVKRINEITTHLDDAIVMKGP